MNTTYVIFVTSTVVTKNVGRITQIIGPVLDAAFSPGKMPNIYNSLVVKGQNAAFKKNTRCYIN